MSQNKELIVSYTRKDFVIETTTGSGAGGQHRNKTQSRVRITHIPSGLSVYSDETRSQSQNKKLAFRRLADKVKQWVIQQNQTETFVMPAETVRTYHAVDNRVKDHVSGFQQRYDEVMNDIGNMIHARKDAIQGKNL